MNKTINYILLFIIYGLFSNTYLSAATIDKALRQKAIERINEVNRQEELRQKDNLKKLEHKKPIYLQNNNPKSPNRFSKRYL